MKHILCGFLAMGLLAAPARILAEDLPPGGVTPSGETEFKTPEEKSLGAERQDDSVSNNEDGTLNPSDIIVEKGEGSSETGGSVAILDPLPIGPLVISEVMPGTEVNPDRDAWVELYNPTDTEVALEGWQIRGLTAAGTWMGISDVPGAKIAPQGYWLLSHYTSSASSALAVAPDTQKTSMLFPGPTIALEIRDGAGRVSDRASLEKGNGAEFRSLERIFKAEDGTKAESWKAATMTINLKSGLTKTFGTPKAANSADQPVGEVEDLMASREGADAVLRWKNPTHPNLESINIYRLLEEGWILAANLTGETDTISDIGEGEMALKVSTVDKTGHESDGRQIRLPPVYRLFLNEILPDANARKGERSFVELWNGGESPRDLKGWKVKSGKEGSEKVYILGQEGKVDRLEPGAFLVLGAAETGLVVGKSGERVLLLDPEGSVIDQRDFPVDQPGRSWGRNAETPEEWEGFNHPTPGTNNIEVNQPPIPVIDLQGGTRGMALNVTGERSQDPDGDRIDFTWLFEPGASDNRPNPTEHVYGTVGEKIVSLTVIDEFGASSVATQAFVAGFPEEESTTSVGTLPSAKSYERGSVRIESVLPNPEGEDEGNETLVLKNKTASIVFLGGWKGVNQKGKKFALPALGLEAGEKVTLNPEDFGLVLANKGDSLTLMDPAGNVIDKIEWGAAESGRSILNAEEGQKGTQAKLLAVVGGESFVAEIEAWPVTVKLLGVRLPSSPSPEKDKTEGGEMAKKTLENRLRGKRITLKFDTTMLDNKERLLAYVWVDGTLINQEWIQNGVGMLDKEPTFSRIDEFAKWEQEAKEKRVGVWEKTESVKKQEAVDNPKKEAGKTKKKTKKDTESVEGDELQDSDVDIEKGDEDVSDCPEEGLEIEAFLPNPQAGEEVEWIRLANVSAETVCLRGWSLDDKPSEGSKPFALAGGALEAGATRAFRKNETKLNLNDKDDCVTLRNPVGETVDQICYQKTRKNEIFTQAGGSEEPKPSTQKAKTVKTKTAKAPKPKAESESYADYLDSLGTEVVEGTLASVDETTQTLYLEDGLKTIPISFAEAKIDMALVSQTLAPGKTLAAEIRPNGEGMELVALRPAGIEEKMEGLDKRDEDGASVAWEWFLLPLLATAGGIAVYAERKNREGRKEVDKKAKED